MIVIEPHLKTEHISLDQSPAAYSRSPDCRDSIDLMNHYCLKVWWKEKGGDRERKREREREMFVILCVYSSISTSVCMYVCANI